MFNIGGLGIKQDKCLAIFWKCFYKGAVIHYIPLTVLLTPMLKSVMIRVSTGFNLQANTLEVCGRSGITAEEKPLPPPLPGTEAGI